MATQTHQFLKAEVRSSKNNAAKDKSAKKSLQARGKMKNNRSITKIEPKYKKKVFRNTERGTKTQQTARRRSPARFSWRFRYSAKKNLFRKKGRARHDHKRGPKGPSTCIRQKTRQITSTNGKFANSRISNRLVKGN